MNVNRVSLTHYENGTQIPPVPVLKRIAEELDKPMTFFFSDEQEQVKSIVKKELKSNFTAYTDYFPENLQLKGMVLVKKLDILAGAGSSGVFDVTMLEGGGVVPVAREILGHLNPVNVRAIEIVGDSMEPEYYEKDIALIDMVNNRYDFTKNAGVYVVRADEAVYIKRVEFMPKGGLKLMSLNKNYGEIILSPDDNYEILGKVCGKVHYEIYKGLVFDE